MVEICSDLTIFDFDRLQYETGSRGPPRRDHAAAVLGRHMLVHGGISHGSTISNEFHVYNFDQNAWTELKQLGG